MSPKQIDIIKNKISRIKLDLANEKKRYGGHIDRGGLRYLPPELYLKLNDYKGALRYFNWFHKNFDDDLGFPIFLFEWSITLFKCKKFKEAEKMVLKTFFSNTYLIDKFFDKEFLELGLKEESNWEKRELVENLIYHHSIAELIDFSSWLSEFSNSPKFYQYANEFIDIERQLMSEPVGIKRSKLVNRRFSLLNDYT